MGSEESGTRGQGEWETRRKKFLVSLSPCPLVPLSPCPPVSHSPLPTPWLKYSGTLSGPWRSNARSGNSMSSHFLNRFLDFHRAPFTLLALLACAAASGSAFAQTVSGASQQTSQSNPATPNGEFMPVQRSVRGFVVAFLR